MLLFQAFQLTNTKNPKRKHRLCLDLQLFISADLEQDLERRL